MYVSPVPVTHTLKATVDCLVALHRHYYHLAPLPQRHVQQIEQKCHNQTLIRPKKLFHISSPTQPVHNSRPPPPLTDVHEVRHPPAHPHPMTSTDGTRHACCKPLRIASTHLSTNHNHPPEHLQPPSHPHPSRSHCCYHPHAWQQIHYGDPGTTASSSRRGSPLQQHRHSNTHQLPPKPGSLVWEAGSSRHGDRQNLTNPRTVHCTLLPVLRHCLPHRALELAAQGLVHPSHQPSGTTLTTPTNRHITAGPHS